MQDKQGLAMCFSWCRGSAVSDKERNGPVNHGVIIMNTMPCVKLIMRIGEHILQNMKHIIIPSAQTAIL